MPKETIADAAGNYDVRVGWSPEPTGHVQVGVETAQGHALASLLYGDPTVLERIGRQLAKDGYEPPFYREQGECDGEFMQRIGRHLLNLVEGSGPADPENTSYTGVWSTLDRAGCNRLIKAVRRARDSAFGRDE